MPHVGYGDCTVVFTKATIDPKWSSANRVYSGDAWTPVFPSVDKKISSTKRKEVADKIISLVGGMEKYNMLGSANLDMDNMTDKFNRWADAVNAYGDSDIIKYAYLQDTGKGFDIPTKDKLYMEGKGVSNEALGALAIVLGDDIVNEMHEQGYSFYKEHPDIVDRIRLSLNEAYIRENPIPYDGIKDQDLKGYQKKIREQHYHMFDEDDGTLSWSEYDRAVRAMYSYRKRGAMQVLDSKQFKDMINDNLTNKTEYESWITSLFDGIIEKEGIRNNVDFFTPSGNRRSFEALHYEVTLENVVRAMKQQEQQGAGNALFDVMQIWGVATRKYSSIEDIKNDVARLVHQDDEERQKLREQYTDRLIEIASAIKDTREPNGFAAMDRAGEAIVDSLRGAKNVASINRRLKEWYGLHVTDHTAQNILDLYNDIMRMPTDYFEAKPVRAVGLDEIAYVTIPANADSKLVDALDKRGIAHVSYEVVKGNDAKTDENRTEATNEKLDVANHTLFSKKIDTTLDIRDPNTIYVDDLYDDVPKEFRGALFHMDDRLYPGEFDEARSEIFKLANGRRLKHQSMRFMGEVESANHFFYFESYGINDFHVFEIINIESPNITATKGVEFNGRQAQDISRIVSRIRNDREIYASDFSGNDNGNSSKRDAQGISRNAAGDRGRSDEDSVQNKEIRQSSKIDSEGNTLTEGQQNYFAESKIRDNNGNLLLVYHGTSHGGFTIFKNGLVYFTADKKYADRYTRSSGNGRAGNTPQIYEGYLNITKPFDISDSKVRKIFIDEYIKGGYAMGINPLASKAEIDSYIAAGIDWNEADNLKDFIDDKGYDFDGIILNEGGDLTENGTVMRGNSFVAFSSEQFKNKTNLNPTTNPDIRKSVKMDSEGRTLSEGQQSFFSNSQARDDQGRLLVLFHGTIRPGFTEFSTEQFNFFSTSRFTANSFAMPDGTMAKRFDPETGEGSIYACYVNLTNPLVIDVSRVAFEGEKTNASIEYYENTGKYVVSLENEKGKKFKRTTYHIEDIFDDKTVEQISKYFETHHPKKLYEATNYTIRGKKVKIIEPSHYYDIVYNGQEHSVDTLADLAYKEGYDGLIVKNVLEGDEESNYGNTDVVSFYPDQIKLTSNLNPTESTDLRKSVKMDSNGKVLTEGQQNYFKDSKVVDDQGRLLVVYHGTYEDFEAFKPNKFTTEKNGLSKIVGYFSEDKEYAKIYGDTKAYYLNIKNPLVMDGEAKTLKGWEKFFKANGVTDFEFDSSVTGKNGQADPLKGGRFEDGTYYAFYELLDSSEYWYGDGNLSERIQAAGYDGIQSNDEFEKAWMPFNAEAVKSVDNANPTDSESVLKSTKLPPEAQKLVDELTLENKRLTEENTALKMEKGIEKAKAEKQAIIDKITEQSQVLSRWLLTNDKTNPVPQAIKEPLGKLLTSISFTKDDYEWRKSKGNLTKSEETLGQRMAKISQLLLEIEQDKVADKDAYDLSQLDWIPEFTTEFAKIKDAVAAVEARQGENFNLSKMSTADLESLSNMITALKSAITNMNKCLSAHNKESVSGVGQEIISYLDSIGQKKFDNRATQFLEIDNTVPFYFFKRLGAGGQKAFKLLMDGMNQYAFEAKQIEDYAKETFSGKDVNAWRNEVKTFTVDEIEYGTVKGEDLVQPRKKTIQMTVPQIMSLYCLSKRDQAINHLKTGGIKIGDFKVKGAKETTRQIENTTLTKASLETIINSLTAEQKEVADKLQEFMNTVCQKWGNEITMKRFGFKGMTEKNYFPIKVDQNQLSREARQRGTSLYQLLNMGFTKPINPNAKNPIEIFDIFEVFAMHSTEMAQYHSLALPVLDVIRIWNYKDVEMLDEAENKAHWHSVKASIENTLGAQGNRYIGLLLADMNGDVSGGRADDFAGKMMKNYKTAAVAANLQVAALQPLSYIRAGYMIDSKYLAKGMAMKSTKEALKWCGIAVWKDMGFYNTSIHRGLEHKIMQDESKKESIIEKGLYLAGKADEWTWSKLWNACLLETKDKYPALEGDDLYKETAERLTEVIYGTQVVDSILTRSQIMRDKTMYSKMITAFQSEPTLALNVLMDAAESFSMEARRSGKQAALKKYGETIRRAATIYLISSAVESLLRAVIGKIRNYDGDEDDENLIVDFFKRFIEELNPLRKIPIIKDAWSILFDGFKVIFGWQYKIYTDTRMDEAIFENLGKATIRIGNLIKGKAINYKVLYEIAKGIDASGVPVSSTFRAFKVFWNNTVGRIWPGITLK